MARYITPLGVWIYDDNGRVLQQLPAAAFVTPAGGETATTQMGDTDHGHDGQAEANPSNPRAGDYATTFAVTNPDPGSPWRALARALAPKPVDTREGTCESELEVVETDMPILASRVARLRFNGNGLHWGAAAQANFDFGVDTDAECRDTFRAFYSGTWTFDAAEPAHKAPVVDCSCGFYATPLGCKPYSLEPHFVNLLVELSGDVIECELLYRAGHQRVIECQLPRCMYCGQPSNIIDVHNGQMTRAACGERHLERRKNAIRLDIDDLATLLPVPVTSMDPPG